MARRLTAQEAELVLLLTRALEQEQAKQRRPARNEPCEQIVEGVLTAPVDLGVAALDLGVTALEAPVRVLDWFFGD